MKQNIKQLTKICTKCKIEKPIKDFSKHKITKDGLNHRCRECNSDRHKKYYQEHEQEHRDYNKKYRQEHGQERRDYHKKYYQEHKQEMLECVKKHYQEHKPERKEYHKKYCQEHKQKDSKYFKKIRETTSKSYIKTIIRQGTGLPSKYITEDMIEITRMRILIYRFFHKNDKEAGKLINKYYNQHFNGGNNVNNNH